MKVIALANPLQGVGKSRTSWDLLVAFLDIGMNTVAVECDSDDGLGQLNRARAAGGAADLPVLRGATAKNIGALLAGAAKANVTLILLDTPPADRTTDIVGLLAGADLVLVPTLADPAAIAGTTRLIRPLRKSGKLFYFLLIRTPAVGLSIDPSFLDALGMTSDQAAKRLVPTGVADRRRLLSDLDALGLGVLEAFGNARIDQESVGKASQEIRSIREFLRDTLSF